MSLNASKSRNDSGITREPMEPGTYPVRLIQVIDLGLQEQRPWKDEPKPPAYEIMVTYEFIDEFLKDEDGQDMEDKPRWLSERFVLYSLRADKAKSTARIRGFDPTDEVGGNWPDLLGQPAMATVIHNPNKKTGGVYENVEAVKPMREKDKESCRPLVNEAQTFDLDDPDLEVFNSLAGWQQKIIVGGLTFDESPLAGMIDATPLKEDEKGTPVIKTVDSAADDDADELPF